MSYQPHYISSYEGESGLHTYYEPFIIPEKAFPILEDAYCFRGRVKRREGFELLGRLRRDFLKAGLGPFNIAAAGAGTFTFDIFALLGISPTQPLAHIQPGTAADPITIAIGPPINQVLTDATGTGTLTIAPAGVITAATLNYNTGILTLTFSGAAGASATTIFFAYYPNLPVMGLRRRELRAVNDEQLVAFDQRYAYRFNAATRQFEELPSAAATVWQGTNSDFFWTTNYYRSAAGDDLFWAVNGNMAGATRDPIRYYDSLTWTGFEPLITDPLGTNLALFNANILVPYKDRLLAFNTWEGIATGGGGGGINNAVNFPRRVRWSQNGTPVVAVDPTAWRQDIVGKGGYLDAPTGEVIVGVEFIKDTLLVKFERSSWKLVYTGNEVLPFVFQKINTELGSESQFSLVPFDRGVYSISNVGVTTDDSVNVERIDIQIPNTVFQFKNLADGVERVYGIRDFYNELVYWTYPNFTNTGEAQTPAVFPNRILLYNYRNNTYAIFNDSFTCFGYNQPQSNKTWGELTDFTWEDWNTAWNAGVMQGLFPDVVAGNQHGFVETLAKKTLNDPSLFIDSINFVTDQFTIPNHNLKDDDIVKITGVIGGGTVDPSLLNGKTYKVSYVDANTITLQVFYPLNSTFYLLTDYALGPLVDVGSIYLGNGVVRKFNNINIATKIFAPFYEQGSQCRLGYIDYLLEKTDTGQISSNIYIDEQPYTSISDSISNPALNGSNVVLTSPENAALIPYQLNQEKIWHRQFIQSVAQNFQIVLTMTDVQNANEDIVGEDIVLHAMTFYLSPNARLTQ